MENIKEWSENIKNNLTIEQIKDQNLIYNYTLIYYKTT